MRVRALLAVCVALMVGTLIQGCKRQEGGPAVVEAVPPASQAPKAAEAPKAANAPGAAEAPKAAETSKAAEAQEPAEVPQATEVQAEGASLLPVPSRALDLGEEETEATSELISLPCEQVLQLGPTGYVGKLGATPDDEPSVRALLKGMFRWYRGCRQQTVQAQYDALDAATQERVEDLRDGLEDFAISVHGFEELRIRGEPKDFLRRRARALMKGEDVLVGVVQELAASDAGVREVLGKEGFAATSKKTFAFMSRPVETSSAEEEKTHEQYLRGLHRSHGKLESALSAMPTSAVQPVLAHIEGLLKP